MNHAHRFHFDAPPVIENVFFDDQSRGTAGFRLTFGKPMTAKPVKPATADSLQRSRDRIRHLRVQMQTQIEDIAIAMPQPDRRAEMARARLKMAIKRTAENLTYSAPTVALFGAKPNQPICINKRARLANISQRGLSNAAERKLRQALHQEVTQQASLLDRLLHLNNQEPALVLVH